MKARFRKVMPLVCGISTCDDRATHEVLLEDLDGTESRMNFYCIRHAKLLAYRYTISDERGELKP